MGFLFGKGKNTTNRADMIADFQINTASYGEVVPEILGTTRVSGNIIDYEDFTAHEQVKAAARNIQKLHTLIQ